MDLDQPLDVTLPELVFVAGTRAVGAAGFGLLLADSLRPRQRRALGWALLAVGVLTTLPIAHAVLEATRDD
ncbi:MAG: hypothetical protein JSR18_08495 [Proteobacteria bacterium]|nr:hypothetical protein [Pseudomonadota bacterium]